MAERSTPRIDLRPGPFLRAAAGRLDTSSRRGLPVTLAAACAVLSFLGFLSIAQEAIEPVSLALDRAATAFSSLLANPALTRVMWVATLMGDTRVMVVETLAAAVLLVAWGHPRRAGSVVVLMLVGVGISTALKGVLERARPSAAFALIATPESFSFPSGHALASCLLFGMLAAMLIVSHTPRPVRAWGAIAMVCVGLLIGLSRVYLGVHYFSDVLGSWLLGLTLLSTWAAAVLVWGRTHSAPQPGSAPWGPPAWRWLLASAGALAVAAAIVADSAVTRLR